MRFEWDVWFVRTTFSGNARFDGSEFTRYASFDGAIFSKNAHFNGIKFSGDTSFDGVTFYHHATFEGSKFLDEASFSTFRGEPLSDDVIFSKFLGDATFEYAKFHRKAIFDETTFSDTISFNEVEFHDSSHWDKTEFQKVNFLNALFKKPEQTRFYYTNLEGALFSPTLGLERIDFLSPKWIQIGGRNGIFNEVFLKESIKKKWIKKEDIPNAYSETETIYRQLKINYEKKRNYPDAGDFYIGEMEMRRRNPKTPPVEKALIWLYKILSYYGEDYKRTLLWISGLIFFSSYSLMATGMKVKGRIIDYYPNLPQNPDGLNDFIELINVVVRSITLQPSTFAETTSTASRLILTFTTILGILFIALFTLALRRRFRR